MSKIRIIKESISKHIKSTIPEFMKAEKHKEVKDINYWNCLDFAVSTIHKAKAAGIKGAKSKSGPGHTWITYKGKHYDAEHPHGVKSPENLNFYKRDDNFRERRRLLKKLKK